MSESTVHIALFRKIDHTADALDVLRELGIPEEDMSVLSGFRISDKMLGRPMTWTNVPKIAFAGFLVAFVFSIALNWGTPLLYPIHVGGQPLLPVPPTIILTFELSMLGLMISTFLGVLWESVFPSYGPKVYHNGVSGGKIAIVFRCPPEVHEQAHERLVEVGAELVQHAEAQSL